MGWFWRSKAVLPKRIGPNSWLLESPIRQSDLDYISQATTNLVRIMKPGIVIGRVSTSGTSVSGQSPADGLINEGKKCPSCQRFLPRDNFYKDKYKSSGLHTYCKFCTKQRAKQDYLLNRDRAIKAARNYHLLDRYDLSLDDYNNLAGKQNWKCTCCGDDGALSKRGLHVDHDHETGFIRGLLCSRCNSGLGHFKDSIRRLLKAIDYLQRHGKTE